MVKKASDSKVDCKVYYGVGSIGKQVKVCQVWKGSIQADVHASGVALQFASLSSTE